MKKIVIFILTLVISGFSALVSQTITGTLTNARDGETLPGVTIQIKGKSLGVITDGNGKYSIEVPSTEDTLSVSFVGYNKTEVPIAGRLKIDIQLQPVIYDLEEVIVTAYGTAKRASYTGSATVVESGEIAKIQASSVTQALQGVTTGIQVQNPGGKPGDDPEIRIRGISSINGNANPLIVVDGAPYGGSLNAINPNDVESMSILKDASATSLYGARASGGVIMITTKTGNKGSSRVNFSSKFGVTSNAIPFYPRVTNGQFYELNWEALKQGYLDTHSGASLADAETYAHAQLLPRLGNFNSFKEYPLNPDGSLKTGIEERWGSFIYEDEMLRHGARQEYHLDMSGQTEDGLKHYISIGYLNTDAAVTTSNFKRYSARVNVSKKLNNLFESGLNASGSYGDENAPLKGRSIDQVRMMPDIYPPWLWDIANEDWFYDENGEKIMYVNYLKQSDMPGTANWVRRKVPDDNALAWAKYAEGRSEIGNMSTRAFINIYLLKGLSIENSLSVDYAVNSSYIYQPWTSFAYATKGVSSRSKSTDLTYTLSNLLRYATDFNDHNINIMVGHEAYSTKFHSLNAGGNGFPTASLHELSAASTITGASSVEDKHRIESYLSSLTYDFRDKYYMSASFRRDGTSRFAPESRWGNFYSFGASWRISEEFFLQKYEWLDNLTLRLSYGEQGNERISNYYAWLGLYDVIKDAGNSGFSLNTLTNTSLKWERNKQFNFGFETKLFERLYISAEYYIKTSQDLLFNRELPLSTGLGSVAENIGDVENKGFEISVNSVNLNIGNFRWETSLNITHFENVITSLPAEEISAGLRRYTVGKSVYDYYLLDYAGVNPLNGNALFYKDIYETDASGYPVLDANGDKIVIGKETTESVSEASYYYVGSSLPDLYGNLLNSFFYKGIDLSINLTYNIGGYVYDGQYKGMMCSGNRYETYNADIMNYWTPQNTDTDVPRMTTYGVLANQFNTASSRWLASATYARVRNVTLGYTLPQNIVSKLGLSRVRAFFQGDNFLTFYKYKNRGTNPEAGIEGQVDSEIPLQKVFSGGIQVGF
jgi:TonB-linked SusC/RagA family outer membrane protein